MVLSVVQSCCHGSTRRPGSTSHPRPRCSLPSIRSAINESIAQPDHGCTILALIAAGLPPGVMSDHCLASSGNGAAPINRHFPDDSPSAHLGGSLPAIRWPLQRRQRRDDVCGRSGWSLIAVRPKIRPCKGTSGRSCPADSLRSQQWRRRSTSNRRQRAKRRDGIEDLLEQRVGHHHLGHLEGDQALVPDDLGPIFTSRWRGFVSDHYLISLLLSARVSVGSIIWREINTPFPESNVPCPREVPQRSR